MSETKDKILNAAEHLFAEQGYGGTSLRHIIAQAGVNLAAIHYHFGSKENLLDALIERQAVPINKARLAMLDGFEAEAGTGLVPVEKILEAFLVPAAEWAADHPESIRLMGRLHAEAMTPAIAERHFKPTGMRFFGALHRSLPHLSEAELSWRFEFMIGAMAIAMTGKLTPLFGGTPDRRGRLVSLVAFVSGGFLARAARPEDVETSK